MPNTTLRDVLKEAVLLRGGTDDPGEESLTLATVIPEDAHNFPCLILVLDSREKIDDLYAALARDTAPRRKSPALKIGGEN